MTTNSAQPSVNLAGSASAASHAVPRVIPRPSRRKLIGGAAPASPSPAGPLTMETVKANPSMAASSLHDLHSRLISETAHDLRAPLTTIREAVRIVRDGDLGHLSSTQKECLSAAINQCNCANQLVDEMVQSGRFDTGFPNVKRGWQCIDELRQSVVDTLQPFVLPRDIHLLWDGPFGSGEMVYADATLLRRLIVNLANNAIRVTRDGQPVLVRAQPVPGQDMMLWSVVDQGTGISASDMELIAAGRAPTRSVGGLGLMISRQLAAAHFSGLRIESRVGTGTAVSFTTPMGGPASIAAQWAAWRTELLNGESARLHDYGRQVHNVLPQKDSSRSARIAPPRRVRIDVPALAVELGLQGHRPAFPDQVVMATIAIGATVNSEQTDQFEDLLARSMRITELAYRIDRRHWVIAWDADQDTAASKQTALIHSIETEMPQLRVTWGDLSTVTGMTHQQPLTESALASRLSDLMIRQSLFVSKRSFCDANQVRLGTNPIRPSAVAAHRLEKEVRRLKEAVRQG